MNGKRNWRAMSAGLLIMFLTVVSCSKKSELSTRMENFIHEYNKGHLESLMTYFADDAQLIMLEGWTKVGKGPIREYFEFQFETNSIANQYGIKQESDTVYYGLDEENDFYRLAGVKQVKYGVQVIFKNDKIRKMTLKQLSQTRRTVREALKSFREWAMQEKPVKWSKLFEKGEFRYGKEGARGWLELLHEWREATGGQAQKPAEKGA